MRREIHTEATFNTAHFASILAQARWEGSLTPDCTVDGALFSIEASGYVGVASLWLDDVR